MREWLVTNGQGGYSSLTHKNTNTRKYHGLLVSALNPPTERWVFVSNIYDKLIIKDKIIRLRDLDPVFNFDYVPNFSYNLDGVKIKKSVLMQHEKNTTILKYDIKTKKEIKIIHQPVINSRHIYNVNSQRYMSFDPTFKKNTIKIKPSNIEKNISISLKDYEFQIDPIWETLYYEKDHKRNDSWIDNNIKIGDFYKTISKPLTYYIVLTTEENQNIDAENVYNDEVERKKDIYTRSNLDKKFKKLVISSDNFIVKKNLYKSIIAGYHWFGDWGRDTLISLPGLTLVTNRAADAKKILLSFSKYCKNGLIPNAFMERDSVAVYNTVDASLWYIDRVFQYLKYTNDKAFLKTIWNTLEDIISGYKNGTDFDIYMDNDYLISHGPGLTWMDVKINDYYPTPRNNKAVEIQALWYNALRIMSVLSQILSKKDIYFELSEKVKNSFCEKYMDQYDVVDTNDMSNRPNKIFLVSLDFSMIDIKMQDKIVENIKENLHTVFGLRTLSKDDDRYKGKYLGDYNKDEAYHNGTVWPWLMGPFITGFLKTKNHGDVFREFCYKNYIKPMLDIFGDKWDGSIHEIYDGDPVYEPRGCISQAWSVAEILRSWVEDIDKIRPNYEKNFFLNKIRV